MQRYFIRLSYLGTHYSGWQIQENAVSVQEKLNQAISVITGEQIQSTGCGRTDTGVHATVFYAHFDVLQTVTDGAKFLYQLNAILPDDIGVQELIPVAPEAHTRFDATSRSYNYYISLTKNPFVHSYAHFIPFTPDISRMNEAGLILTRHTDFSSFSKSNTQVKTNNCKIQNAVWEVRNELLVFNITADRFLRGMVRAVVGTMLEIGNGKLTLQGLEEILESRNRANAGVSVPARGLYLCNVTYEYIAPAKSFIFPA